MEPLNIANKVDSPEKVQAVQDIPDNQKMMASEFNQVKNKVNELVVEANKKTPDLANPDHNKYPTTKAVVDGLALKPDYPDEVTAIGAIIQDGQNITINSASWRIKAVAYTKASQSIFTVPFTSPGLCRIDFIVGNTANDLVRISGAESLSPVPPGVPEGTVVVTQFAVSESKVGRASQPINQAAILKSEVAEMHIVSTYNVNDLDPAGKDTLVVNNTITLTGIKAGYDGREITIINRSNGHITFAHNSEDSITANRFFIPIAEQDLSIRSQSRVSFKYSKAQARWELTNTFGSGYNPNLVSAGGELRIVTVTEEGIMFSEPIMEFMLVDETTTGFASLSEVATAYPAELGYKKLFHVFCPYMTPQTMYIKYGDGDDLWSKNTGYIKMT